MRTLRGSSILAAAAAALVVAVALGSCSSSNGSGAGTATPGSSATPDGGMPSWLAAALSSPGAFTTAGPGGSAGPVSSGLSASNAPSQTAAPTATAAPTSQATVRTTVTPRPATPRPATPRPATPLPVTPPPATPTALATALKPCYVFPSSNVWNRDISGLPVASNSDAMVSAIGLDAYLHPDFDAIGDGIPYNIVTSSTPTYTVAFDYADESDPGPYPIPSSPRIEAGSDRHLISIDVTQCKLWELYDVRKSGSGWAAGSGAVFDLRSNALRPEGWTSADAAGLPIFPGLVRYDEVLSGSIDHAIQFTAPNTCGYIYPARHQTADPCSNLPPMGLRIRLKASVDISGFGPHAQVVLTALKRYGMILADNGSPWYITGAPDSRWNDDEMHQLQTLTGADFEVVDTSGLRNG